MDQLRAGVFQHEASSAISVFCFTGVETSLPNERGLLIAQNSGDGDILNRIELGFAVDFAARCDLRKYFFRDAVRREHFLIPGQSREIHQLRAAGVGHISHMDATLRAASQLPKQKGIYISEKQISSVGGFLRSRNILQDPANLQSAEIGSQWQSGLSAKTILAAITREFRHG